VTVMEFPPSKYQTPTGAAKLSASRGVGGGKMCAIGVQMLASHRTDGAKVAVLVSS